MVMPLRGRNTAPLILVVLGLGLVIGLGKYLLDAESSTDRIQAPSSPSQSAEPVPVVPPGQVTPTRTEALPEPGSDSDPASLPPASTERGRLVGRVLFAKERGPAADSVVRLTVQRPPLVSMQV